MLSAGPSLTASLCLALALSLPAAAAPDAGTLLPAPPPFRPKVQDPLLAPAPRPPREVRSWDEALALVRAHSSDERNAAFAVERAEGRWRQSLSALLPNLRLSGVAAYDVLNPGTPLLGSAAGATGGSAGPTPTSGPVATTPVAGATVALSQSLIDLSAWQGLSASSASRRSAEQSLEDVRRRVTLTLARTLVAVVAAERVAELNRLGLSQALERAALTERTSELGAATLVDVTRVRQDVEVARGALLLGDEQLRRTREALGVALGLQEEVGVPQGFVLTGLVEQAQRSCRPLSGEERADVKAAREAAQSAKAAQNQATAGYLPSLALTSSVFGYTTNPGPGRVGSWSVAAVLSLPLWEGGGRAGLTRDRSGARKQAEEALTATQRQVAFESARARRGVGVAEQLLASAEQARALAAQLDALTRRAFEVGRGSSLELVQSAALLRQADVALATREFELVQARLDAVMTEARCDQG